MRRYCVVWVPDWPVVAAVQEGLADPLDPIAIHNNRELLAVSPAARGAKVRTGMRRRKARSVCPELRLIVHDQARDSRAFDGVVQAVGNVLATPATLRPGLVMAHAPARVPEEEVMHNLTEEIAQSSGAEAFVGIASGFLTAILAARAHAIVPENQSAQFLAPHPVAAVRHALLTRTAHAEVQPIFDAFSVLGVRTLADIVAIPRGDLASRFGVLGERFHRLACGGDVRIAPAASHGADIRMIRELDPPVDRSDAAAFAVRVLAEDLADRLAGRSCGRLRATVRTETEELSRVWLIEGTIAAAEITDRVRWQIDGWLSGRSGGRPSAPLRSLELEAQEIDGAAARTERLWGRSKSSEVAERAVLRLSGMYGVSVERPIHQGGRDPRSRIRVVAWNDGLSSVRRRDAPWPGGVPEPFPPTVLDEPHPVRLLDSRGNPVTVDSAGLVNSEPATIQADGAQWDVQAWSGPWNIRERWWSQAHRAAWFQVTRVDAPALLIALRDGEAFVEGVYD